MINTEEGILTRLTIGNYIITDLNEVAKILSVSQPKKAGKHGSAKIFYSYYLLKDSRKVETVGSSRDKVTVLKVSLDKAELLFEDTQEISFISGEETILIPREDLIRLSSDVEDPAILFYFFKYQDLYYYHNGK